MKIQQRITPFLSYDVQAEEAAKLYVSVLPDSKILRTVSNPVNGAVLTVEFELSGLKFVALNAGQSWKFTEATSFSVACESQEELDRVWEQLSEGGREVNCGWLQDRFGMFWQVVPAQLEQWLQSNNPQKVQSMFEALWQMKKLDIAQLQQAFEAG